MQLQQTLDLYAGGEGSGCRGPNCGRPSLEHIEELHKQLNNGKLVKSKDAGKLNPILRSVRKDYNNSLDDLIGLYRRNLGQDYKGTLSSKQASLLQKASDKNLPWSEASQKAGIDVGAIDPSTELQDAFKTFVSNWTESSGYDVGSQYALEKNTTPIAKAINNMLDNAKKITVPMYRGFTVDTKTANNILKKANEGKLDVGYAGVSPKESVAKRYASDPDEDKTSKSIIYEFPKGVKALPIHPAAGEYAWEKEHIVRGVFKVQSIDTKGSIIRIKFKSN